MPQWNPATTGTSGPADTFFCLPLSMVIRPSRSVLICLCSGHYVIRAFERGQVFDQILPYASLEARDTLGLGTHAKASRFRGTIAQTSVPVPLAQ
jgi:hypothetical protein